MTRAVTAATVLALAAAPAAQATWSICMADSETGEVAVGTVTCLNNFDLLALVPVVVVGKGVGACQAAGDFDGQRRPIIFQGLQQGTPPAQILAQLALVPGHQSRQYGIADTNGDAITFTGNQAMQWAGGLIGQSGTLVYAVQGNVLAGACVVSAIEQALLGTPGDIPARLMAGMQAARLAGGDGRCSCTPGNPTACGCPPGFGKSGHIGCMVVARIGDADDPVCNSGGCAGGDYFMTFNVAFQQSGAPDPVVQMQAMFDFWRESLFGRPDAIQSVVTFDPPVIPANGSSMTTMLITLLDWYGKPIAVPITALTVEHGAGSAGLSTIGPASDAGGGVFTVVLTAGSGPGVDRFVVEVDDGIRPVTLMPEPALEYFPLGDVNGDGLVEVSDLVQLVLSWGPCGGCPEDLDGSGAVDVGDLVALILGWG